MAKAKVTTKTPRLPSAEDLTADVSTLQARLLEAKRQGDATREVAMLFAIAERALSDGDAGLANMHFDLAAKVIRARSVQQDRLAEALGERALILRTAKRFPQAIELATAAVAAAREHGGKAESGRWLSVLGNLYRLAKQPIEARRAFLEAQADYREAGLAGAAGLADQEGNLGLLEVEEGNLVAAESAYRRAVAAARSAKSIKVEQTWETNLANALTRRRAYSAAWSHYEHALGLARELSDVDRILSTAKRWINSYAQASAYGEAARLAMETAESLPKPAAASLLADAVKNLHYIEDFEREVALGARTLALLQELQVAEEHVAPIRERVESARSHVDNPNASPWQGDQGTPFEYFLIELLVHAERTKDPFAMGLAAHAICDIAIGLEDPSSWQSLTKDPSLRFRVVADAIRVFVDNQRISESLEISVRWKSVGFAHPSIDRALLADASDGKQRVMIEAHRRLREAVRALTVATPHNVARCFYAVRAAGELMLDAGRELRTSDAKASAKLGGLVEPNDLLDALPLDSPVGIVDLSVGPSGTTVHILRRAGSEVVVSAGVASSLTGEDVAQLARVWFGHRVNLETGPQQDDALAFVAGALHDKLFCGLADQLAQLRLTQAILVPDALLAFLPLHIARICEHNVKVIMQSIQMKDPPERAEHFCDAFPVEYASCLQVIATSQYQRFPARVSKLLSLADSQDDLPAARATAAWLKDALPEKVAFVAETGAAATKQCLREHLSSSDLVVIATHGALAPQHISQSGLVFADGDWTLADMLAEPALSHGPAVVLAACEVGASTISPDPREWSGIPGALIAAGAASVLAASWPVEDVSAGYLVERFIRHLSRRGLRPSAALFRAVIELRRLSKQDVIERCDRLIHALREQPEARVSEQILRIDYLRDVVRSGEAAHPFDSASFWAPFMVIGSGWHTPAGGVVGAGASVNVIEALVERRGARSLIVRRRAAEAVLALRPHLQTLEGSELAASLDALAWASFRSRSKGTEAAAAYEAELLLSRAESLAKAEGREQLLHNIAATRAKIALRRSNVDEEDAGSVGATVSRPVQPEPAEGAPRRKRRR